MWNTTRQYRASVLIKGRRNAPEIEYRNNTYIEGRPGSRYELELQNNSSGRILVIPSVDGLSILDGKPCGLKSPGYVIDAWQTLKIPGWKVDGKTAAEFVFGGIGKGDTYVEQMGYDPANQGVIGFAVFREKVVHQYQAQPFWNGGVLRAARNVPMYGSGVSSGINMSNSLSTKTFSKSLGTLSASAQPEALGTGWGDAVDFKTTKTTFVRENENVPNAMMEIYYDTLENLRVNGVPVEKFKKTGKTDLYERKAFPASPELRSTGATPPPGWLARRKKR